MFNRLSMWSETYLKYFKSFCGSDGLVLWLDGTDVDEKLLLISQFKS